MDQSPTPNAAPTPSPSPASPRVITTIALRGEAVDPATIEAIPLLKDAARFVTQHPGCIRRRTIAVGEVICRQGDAGRTAFYLLSGSAVVHLESRRRSKKPRREGVWARVRRLLNKEFHLPGVGVGGAGQASPDRPIGVDASTLVTNQRRLAVLEAGSIFGEIACLTRQPRSATVTAAEPCEVLEIIRTVLDRLRDRSEAFRSVVIEADRRKLVAILKAAPMFRDLAPEAIEILRTRAEARTLAPGEVIFKQSQTADAIYVIRVGQVRVSQFAGQTGEVTICYLGEGDVFGEQGLLEAGLRPVTCSAYGAEVGMRRWYAHPPPRAIRPTRVEVFRIGRDACLEAFRADPRFRKRLESLARRRTEKDRTTRLTPVSLPVLTHRAEAMGLPQGQRLLLIDMEACTRCDQCVQACVSAHDDGLPRMIREGPTLDTFQVPSRCRSCLDPVCMIGCPVGSIGRRDDFSMFIEDWCIGCGICAGNCPYGSIQMHPRDPRVHPVPEMPVVASPGPAGQALPHSADRIAAVCDQCHGLPTGPACRYACPHDAIVITDSSKAFDLHVAQVGDSLSGSVVPWSMTVGTESNNSTTSTKAALSDPRFHRDQS